MLIKAGWCIDVKKVCVIGSGTMGNGIAQVCAQAGLSVSLCDVKDEFLERALKTIKGSLAKFVEKGIVKESVDTVVARIKTSTSLDACVSESTDLVIGRTCAFIPQPS